MKLTREIILLLTLVASVFVVYKTLNNPSEKIKSQTNQLSKTPYYLDNKTIKTGNLQVTSESSLKKVSVSYLSPMDLSAKFGLTGDPKSAGDTLTWESGSEKLNYNQKDSNFEYTSSSKASTTDLKTISEAEKIATDFVSQKNIISPEFQTKISSTVLIQDLSGLGRTTEFSKAIQIGVYLQPTFESKPVLTQTPATSVLAVFVDKKGNVVRFGGPQPLLVGSQTTVALKQGKEAINEVKNKKGKVVSVNSPSTKELVTNFDYKELEVTDSYLGYLLEESHLVPIFVFSAKATNSDGKNLDLVLYLPATK